MQISLFFPDKHFTSESKPQIKVSEKGEKTVSCISPGFESGGAGNSFERTPLSFFLRYLSSRSLQCHLFFKSRPSQGVLKLSDLSKMFTSSLPLVSFRALLQNKSWQRCTVVCSLTPPFQLSDTCWVLKKICLQEPNFIEGRKLLLPAY